jgi:hypothetical protein
MVRLRYVTTACDQRHPRGKATTLGSKPLYAKHLGVAVSAAKREEATVTG